MQDAQQLDFSGGRYLLSHGNVDREAGLKLFLTHDSVSNHPMGFEKSYLSLDDNDMDRS